MFSDKQIHMDIDKIVSFVIQSGQVSGTEQSPHRVMLIITPLVTNMYVEETCAC